MSRVEDRTWSSWASEEFCSSSHSPCVSRAWSSVVGSTRTDRRRAGRPRRVTALGCALAGVLLLLAGSGVWKEVNPQNAPEPATAAPRTSSPTASSTTETPSAPPSATSAPPQPTVTATPTNASSIRHVDPAMPESITVDGPGIHFTRKFGSEVLPPTVSPKTGRLGFFPSVEREDWMKVWLEKAPEMNLPGSPARGTAFVIGHTCRAASCEGAFEHLQEIEGKAGVMVRLKLVSGETLLYAVTRAEASSKTKTFQNTEFYAYDEPYGLRLVTCKLRPDGEKATDDFLVWATLVAVE